VAYGTGLRQEGDYGTSVEALAALADEPSRAALLLDVDGTLAPIVADPEDARVPETTRTALARLAGVYGLVACVSGRPAEVARAIVGVPGLTYVGEHGLELDPEAAAWAPRIRELAASACWPVEEKPIAAAFHYRTAPDREEARRVLARIAEAAEAQGLRARWGRLVLEVLPPIDATKGTAVRQLLEQHALRRALYAGDDTTDLDAFAALDGLEVAVRIAVASPESPPALRQQADIVVGSPEELAEILSRL
jgi:trehalose 6-phosphate phosphatase